MCWCLSQEILGILHETQAKHCVMLDGRHCYSQCCNGQNSDFALLKLIKHTNRDIKAAACLDVVHLLKHPTSYQFTKSTQIIRVTFAKMNLLPLHAAKYGILTMRSTWQCQKENKYKNGLDATQVPAIGEFCSFQLKTKLAVEERKETNILHNNQKKKLIENCVDRETEVAKKRV